MNEIEKKYLQKGFGFTDASGKVYIEREYVLQFVEQCDKENILIFRADAFELKEDNFITPKIEMYVNCARTYNSFLKKDWITLREKSDDFAKKTITSFLSDKNTNLAFNFILVDEEKYNQDKINL